MPAVIEPASSQSNYRGAMHSWLVSLMQWLIGMVRCSERSGNEYAICDDETT